MIPGKLFARHGLAALVEDDAARSGLQPYQQGGGFEVGGFAVRDFGDLEAGQAYSPAAGSSAVEIARNKLLFAAACLEAANGEGYRSASSVPAGCGAGPVYRRQIASCSRGISEDHIFSRL